MMQGGYYYVPAPNQYASLPVITSSYQHIALQDRLAGTPAALILPPRNSSPRIITGAITRRPAIMYAAAI